MRQHNHLMAKWSALFAALLVLPLWLTAQTVIRGTVTDRENGETLIGANITLVGRFGGTITDLDGSFQLETTTALPFRIRISYMGYQSEEIEVQSAIQPLSVLLTPSPVLVSDIVVAASRIDERVMQAPVTIETMGPVDIRQAASPDFYDAITNLKGVQMARGSLTFVSINTRGFGAVANERFVQLIDGMDNAAPILNFPMGNIVGISDLDVARVELVPGAASALYGPNAFNGILIMDSKSPFDYPGLSVETKGGITNSTAGGTHPYYQFGARYAHVFGKKLAIKADASYLTATDWTANDYITGRGTLFNLDPSSAGAPDFDGLNTYGDETRIFVPMSVLAEPLSQAMAPAVAAQLQIPVELAQYLLAQNLPNLPTLDIRRSGFKEEDIIDSRDAKSLKLNASVHFRPIEGLEAIYQYRFGQGSTIYQGGDRFPLRDFTQQYHKLELKGGNFFLRGYAALTDAGNSYNMTALGGYANEYFKPSQQWVGEYAAAYASVLLPMLMNGGELGELAIAQAHAAGRLFADRDIPKPGSPEFKAVIDQVRSGYFQRMPPGASFIDESRIYHVEGNYLIKELAPILDLQIGGNFRRYDLFTDGTVINENPLGDTPDARVTIDEFGFYLQAGKPFANDRLKLTASIRYDENENFKGQFSPRVAMTFTPDGARDHNFRASYQTGFRNPATQQQFIFFPQADAILLGSARANAERYGVHEGNAFTNSSYNEFLESAIKGQPNPALLQTVNIDYIQPEKLQVYELGYKGLFDRRFLLDLNGYYNRYSDFITQQTVRAINGTSHQGQYLPGVTDMLAGQATQATGFELFVNTPEIVTSYGVGIGLTWEVTRGFQAYGHYNFTEFNVEEPGPDFEERFNMPRNKFLFGVSNRKLFNRRLGFNVSYRWQDAFKWQSSFGQADIPAFGVVDGQISYLFREVNTTLKIGGSNLFGADYRTNIGGPFIGPIYYIGMTYNPAVR